MVAQVKKAVQSPDGKVLYEKRCASCHEAGTLRAVSREAMKRMSFENLRFALTKGSMKAQASGLSREQLDNLVRFLAGRSQDKPDGEGFCSSSEAFGEPLAQPHWNGWGADLTQHRFQPAEMAQLPADKVSKLKLKWAFGVSGVSRMFGQPTIAAGRVFFGGANRKVYALDAKTGCTYWVFTAEAGVRTAMTLGAIGQRWAVYFGDQQANAYAVDASTGKLIWKQHLDEHPAAVITGAPVLADGKLYVPMSSLEEATGAIPTYECCRFRGSLSALDAATGKVLWKSYTIAEEPKPVRKNSQGVQQWGPSGAAIWSAPTVDLSKRLVYAATGDSYSDPPAKTSDAFLAFDMDSGKLVWFRQLTTGDAYNFGCTHPSPEMQINCPESKGPDADFGSSPILVELGGGRRALIAGQKSGIVHAIDPDRQGAILWQKQVGQGGPLGGVQWGSAVDAENVYVAVSDVRTRPVPEGTAGAQKSPFFGAAFQLDPKAGGGIWALKLDTGETVWQTPHPGCKDTPTCSPAQSAAVTAIPGLVFSGGLDGHIRAYSVANGRIVWDMDTEQEFKTVNGVEASGGSMDGPGPVIVDGIVYVSSGYGDLGRMPGNVLLAFSVDGR